MSKEQLYYRLTYNNEGIYNALKKNISIDEWKKILSSKNFNWLPKPPNYEGNYQSYFTQLGYSNYKNKALPLISKYLDENKIVIETTSNIENYVYKDKYQIIIKKS